MSCKYFIKTFGCQQNVADSERIAGFYESRGFVPAAAQEEADTIVINTCVIRERAEEKVYGLVRNLEPLREKKPELSIVITGCLIGAAAREPSGKMMKALRTRVPHAQLLPLEEVGFEYVPKRGKGKLASIPISNGCNNYCTYCIVPFSRGKERSRPFEDIVREAEEAVAQGRDEILLLGQNVNSYGADFLMEKLIPPRRDHPDSSQVGEGSRNSKVEIASSKASRNDNVYILPDGTRVEPVMVKHLNRHRIPTLFPHLLERIAKIVDVKKLMFISSNPWDFSNELIDVIARHENIDRMIHLPVQAGSNEVLKRMNRWYTREEYMELIDRIRAKVPEARFTTDIIVGFPGETQKQFEETLELAHRVGFEKAFIAWYSPRPGTAANKWPDDVPFLEKKRRFKELDDFIYRKQIPVWLQ